MKTTKVKGLLIAYNISIFVIAALIFFSALTIMPSIGELIHIFDGKQAAEMPAAAVQSSEGDMYGGFLLLGLIAILCLFFICVAVFCWMLLALLAAIYGITVAVAVCRGKTDARFFRRMRLFGRLCLSIMVTAALLIFAVCRTAANGGGIEIAAPVTLLALTIAASAVPRALDLLISKELQKNSELP